MPSVHARDLFTLVAHRQRLTDTHSTPSNRKLYALRLAGLKGKHLLVREAETEARDTQQAKIILAETDAAHHHVVGTIQALQPRSHPAVDDNRAAAEISAVGSNLVIQWGVATLAVDCAATAQLSEVLQT